MWSKWIQAAWEVDYSGYCVLLSGLYFENRDSHLSSCQEHWHLPSELALGEESNYCRKKTNSLDYASTMGASHIPWLINVDDTKPSPLASIRDISEGSSQLQYSLWNCLRHLWQLYCFSSFPAVQSCFSYSLGDGVLWSTSQQATRMQISIWKSVSWETQPLTHNEETWGYTKLF